MISREQFDKIYQNLNINPELDKEFVFKCFSLCLDGAEQISNNGMFGKILPVNPVVLLLYIVHEYNYVFQLNKNIELNDKLLGQIVSISMDKYFTNEHLNFKNERAITKFDPEISTLETYLNFALSVLNKESKKAPNKSLVYDVMHKGFSMCKAIIQLMEDGFETEAFSTWRTLHETECILILLYKYGESIQKNYIKHIEYTLAFRGVIQDKEKVDKIFEHIKAEMKELNLKSKDMKKYIEYGWLTSIPSYNEDPQFKFNFRDAIEKLAGLSSYSKIYEMASEIAHSSPMLIYARNSRFYHLTLLNLYESFFRIERIFSEIYLKNASVDEKQKFDMMKKIYYVGLINIYNREKQFQMELMKTIKENS